MEFLTSNGARLDIGDESEVTPLMLAAGGGHEACLIVLLHAVQDPKYLDLADAEGKNATHYACISGEAGALALLAAAGACLDLPSGRSEAGDAMHPAHLAVAHGSVECLEELAAWNADLEATDGAGETVLSLAVQCGSEACAEFLLTGGGGGGGVDHSRGDSWPLVDPDRLGRGREPPLHAAARRGRLLLLSLLLQAGANPAVRDNAGETAVHAAARFGQVDVITALGLQAGDQRGDPPRHKRGGSDQREPQSLPSWWGLKTDTGETATFLAAREGYVGVLRALKEVGALDPVTPNYDGVTPMMVTTLAGHEEVISRYGVPRVWVAWCGTNVMLSACVEIQCGTRYDTLALPSCIQEQQFVHQPQYFVAFLPTRIGS